MRPIAVELHHQQLAGILIGIAVTTLVVALIGAAWLISWLWQVAW